MNYSYDTEMDLADHRAIKVSTMQREKLLRTMQATAQAGTTQATMQGTSLSATLPTPVECSLSSLDIQLHNPAELAKTLDLICRQVQEGGADAAQEAVKRGRGARLLVEAMQRQRNEDAVQIAGSRVVAALAFFVPLGKENNAHTQTHTH